MYIQGVRLGGKIVAVRSSDELIAKAMNILQQENAIGVRTLEG